MDVSLRWQDGEKEVAWSFEDSKVVKRFLRAPNSAVAVREPPSVVIVEDPASVSTESNAIVYELDGRERLRLIPPDVSDAIGFYEVFESRAGLVAVFATRGGDLHGVPDLRTGVLHNVREWR